MWRAWGVCVTMALPARHPTHAVSTASDVTPAATFPVHYSVPPCGRESSRPQHGGDSPHTAGVITIMVIKASSRCATSGCLKRKLSHAGLLSRVSFQQNLLLAAELLTRREDRALREECNDCS